MPSTACWWTPVELVGRRSELLKFLRAVPNAGRATLPIPMHVYRAMLGDQYVDDAYVYRSS